MITQTIPQRRGLNQRSLIDKDVNYLLSNWHRLPLATRFKIVYFVWRKVCHARRINNHTE
jgi:hypothetical protein